jgi:RNA polymerase sigma-70 factor, ECF subfamily
MESAWQAAPADSELKNQLAVRGQQLVLAAQAGSSSAFADLRALYEQRLYATIIRITKNREDAEDALQDTFLRAYLALNAFEGRSAVFSWLTRIAINSALMILRRRRRRAEVFFDAPNGDSEEVAPWELKDDAPSPEHLYAFHQTFVRLNNALQRLGPRLRVPLEIHLGEDCSMSEIAQTLGITVAAVKARLYRARRRLAASKFAGLNGAKAIPELLYPGGIALKSTRPQGAATLRIGQEDTLTQELP